MSDEEAVQVFSFDQNEANDKQHNEDQAIHISSRANNRPTGRQSSLVKSPSYLKYITSDSGECGKIDKNKDGSYSHGFDELAANNHVIPEDREQGVCTINTVVDDGRKAVIVNDGNNGENSEQKEPQANVIRPRNRERRESIIAPTESQNMTKSIIYAIGSFSWLFYNAMVLSIVPASIAAVIFGCTWTFDINESTFKIFFLCLNAFLITSTYVTMLALVKYTFGNLRKKNMIYMSTLLFSVAHTVLYTARILYHVNEISFIYYSISVLYMYFLLRSITSAHESVDENKQETSRYDVLSSDGTPMALFKGFIPNLLGYFVSAFYLIPYFMDSGIFTRIIGRVVILPFFHSMVDSYQNSLLIYKTKEHLKYRVAISNMFNIIALAILRFMITDTPNLFDTLLISLSSGVSEVVLRTSYIPRSIYAIKLIRYLKKNAKIPRFYANKIHFFEKSDTHIQSNDRIYDEVADIDAIEVSADGFKRLVSQLNQKDTIASFVLKYHANRSYTVFMGEIQFTIYVPLLLFLYQPVDDYVTIQVIDSVQYMLCSILIQLSIEIVTQFISIALENYFYGLEIPIAKSWRCGMKSRFSVFRTLLTSLTIIYLSTNLSGKQ